jgi:hypothetical protein
MSQAEQRLVFLSGSVVANNAVAVDVSDCRIQSTSFVMLGLPNARVGANAGSAYVSAVSAGKFTIIGGATDTSTYPYYVISSPMFGALKEQSAYIQ